MKQRKPANHPPLHRPEAALASGRRRFLAQAAAVTALLAAGGRVVAASSATGKSGPPIGCFNRPWYKWSFDEAMASIRNAGYDYLGMLGGHQDDPLIGPGATPAYLATLKRRIADRGLTAVSGAFRVNHADPRDKAVAYARERIENAHALGLPYLLTADEPKPEYYAQNIAVMADAAAFAQERGIKLVFKPHGSDAPTLLQLLRDVGHPNFKIWYDAGNILYYTGKDPLADLEPMLEHITGFCAKDCTGPKGEAMIQFGEGQVDFATLFTRFQQARFHGPIMVETCRQGATPAETAQHAKGNRLFIERLRGAR